MNKSIVALLLCVLFAGMASATITVTINSPIDGIQINNTGSNIATYDINFTVADDNALNLDGNSDYNVNIVYHKWSTAKVTNNGTGDGNGVIYIVRDGNLDDWNSMLNGNSTRKCVGVSVASQTCKYSWVIPNNATMGTNDWVLDVNVMDWNQTGVSVFGDKPFTDDNDSHVLYISTRLATMDTAKNVLSMAPIVAIGLFFITLVGALFVAKTDATTAVLAGVGGGILGAIGCMIFGYILAVV